MQGSLRLFGKFKYIVYICLMNNYDNLQPNSGSSLSTESVQRLTGEENTNKPDTNIPHLLKCSQCKELKDLQDFYPSKKYTKRGYDYRCIECCRTRVLKYHYDNRENLLTKWREKRNSLTVEEKNIILEKHRKWYRQDIRMRMLTRAKDRSKKLGIECTITIDDIFIPERCPLLNVPFKYGSQINKWYTYSLDRIDNSKGYIKGNIQVITYLANTMKSQASKEELLTFANNIIKMMT